VSATALPANPATLPGRVCTLAGAFAVAGGVVSLLGWIFDLRRLTDWDGHDISIQPNAAVCAMSAGVALVLLSRGHRRLTALFGLFVLLIAAATIFENLAGVDLGIDTLLMFDRDWGSRATLAPGRMGPPGSLSWTLIGAALMLTSLGGVNARRRMVPVIGLVVCGIASLALMGYLFGADTLYTLPKLTAIAFQTSTFILAAGLGLIACAPDRDPMRTLLADTGAGMLARWTLPFILVLPVVLGILRLQGQRAGWYDTAMGVALLVLILITFLGAVLWFGVKAVGARERALAHSENRKSAILNVSLDGIITMDHMGNIIDFNPAAEQIFGRRREDVIARPLAELMIPTRLRESHYRGLARYRKTGEGRVLGQRLEMPALHADGHEFPIELAISAITGADPPMFTATVRDISDRKRVEQAQRESEERHRKIAEREKLLSSELSHRVKNTLTMVQAMAAQTRRHSTSLEEFETAFAGRIALLARAHGLLTRGAWTGATLSDIVRTTLSPHAQLDDGGVRVDGPEVLLPPKQVVAMSMILHELATNAVKYGSLSKPAGKLDVLWRDGGGKVALHWREKEGPAVTAPARQGFGSALIERLTSFELEGKASIRYELDGLACEIEFPAAANRQSGQQESITSD